MNKKGADQDAQADLRLCCSHMAKTGFLMTWLNWDLENSADPDETGQMPQKMASDLGLQCLMETPSNL